jgi:hypothetical protein
MSRKGSFFLTNASGKFILLLLSILIGYVAVLILSVLTLFLYASLTGSGPISYSDYMNQGDILLAFNSAISVLTFLLPSLVTAYLISLPGVFLLRAFYRSPYSAQRFSYHSPRSLPHGMTPFLFRNG